MKILDRYILTQYLQRLGSVFLILMFIFIIQTFWLFIDEFAGKGIDAEIVIKFLSFLYSKTISLSDAVVGSTGFNHDLWDTCRKL